MLEEFVTGFGASAEGFMQSLDWGEEGSLDQHF
jgi:hypothetical protein